MLGTQPMVYTNYFSLTYCGLHKKSSVVPGFSIRGKVTTISELDRWHYFAFNVDDTNNQRITLRLFM